MSRIHPTALIDSNARIGRDVTIGPFCMIEGDVAIGDRCSLASHVVVKNGVTLGCDNTVCEGVVLGGRPQHLQATGAAGRLEIGEANTLREFVTVHLGLAPEKKTVIGNNNLLMIHSHIGHDCALGNNIIVANNVMLAGHVTIHDRAYLSGAVGVHQFCRIGRMAMVGGQAHISQDVPPFVTIDGFTSHVVGLNVVGLRRSGFNSSQITALKQVYRTVFRRGLSFDEILSELRTQFIDNDAAQQFAAFIAESKRGFVRERRETHRPIFAMDPCTTANADGAVSPREEFRVVAPPDEDEGEGRVTPFRKVG